MNLKLKKLQQNFIDTCTILGVDIEETLCYIVGIEFLENPLDPLKEDINQAFYDEKNKLKVNIFSELVKSKSLKDLEEYLLNNNNISRFRRVFSLTGIKGRRVQGDKRVVVKKLAKFLETYPKYTFEDCIKAATYHVENSDYPMNADNFITKHRTSTLLTCLEEIEQNSSGNFNRKLV